MDFTIDVFKKLDKDWALLSAGTVEDHNAMTVSWGGMGTLWGKPVVTVYVRPNRHTYGYIEENELFTLSFYPEQYRKALGVMGSKSGRDCDKDALAGLDPISAGESVSYRQAEVTLVCRKLYFNDLVEENIPADILKTFYDPEPIHRMYIAEVVDIIKNEA